MTINCLSWFAGLVLALLLIASAALAKVPERVSLQKTAVVAVQVLDAKGVAVLSESGFFVHQDGVVAASCRAIQKWLAAPEHRLIVDMDGRLQFPISEVISSRCVRGHVLFKVNAEGVPTVNLSPAYVPRRGETVYLSTVTKGTKSFTALPVKAAGEPYQTLVAPKTGWAHGSPVFNERGAVIGIAVPVLKGDRATVSVAPARVIESEVVRFKKIQKRLASLPPDYDAAPEPVVPRLREDTGAAEKLAALERAKRRVSDEQPSADAFAALAMAYEDLKMYPNALEAYEQALGIDPRHEESLLRRGTVFYRLGRYREAAEAYRRAADTHPECGRCYGKLGGVYIIMKEYGRAVEAFRQKLRHNPRDANAHFNMGLAHFLNGDYESAIEQYVILRDLDGKKAESLVELLY